MRGKEHAKETMKIIRAEDLGMRFGVRDATALALETAKHGAADHPGLSGFTTKTVLAELRTQGIRSGAATRRCGHANGDDHSPLRFEARINETRGRGLNVIEATCPLVHVAHRSLAKLVREGFHPVIIGKRDHVEVRGMTGRPRRIDVVLDEEDVAKLRERPRFGVVSQTTQPIDGSGSSCK